MKPRLPRAPLPFFVWVIIVGTIASRLAVFMSLPFLAIRLTKETDLSAGMIGLIVGLAPLMGMLFGFVGGHLSDRIGRRLVLIASLVTWAFVFAGFCLARDPWHFMILNALNGVAKSLFEPVSKALIADRTPKEALSRAYGLRYTAINIGAAIGPLIGGYLAIRSAGIGFGITSAVFAIYAIVLAYLTRGGIDEKSKPKTPSLKQAVQILTKDRQLLLFLAAGILVAASYSQLDSTLSQYLIGTRADAITFYSYLMSANAILVIAFQGVVTRIAEYWGSSRSMATGSLMKSAGFLMMAFPGGPTVWLFAGIVAISFGELLIAPVENVIIDDLAPPGLRGAYFGAYHLKTAGYSIGPMFGGFLLGWAGGSPVFITVAGLCVIAAWIFQKGSRVKVETQDQVESNSQAIA